MYWSLIEIVVQLICSGLLLRELYAKTLNSMRELGSARERAADSATERAADSATERAADSATEWAADSATERAADTEVGSGLSVLQIVLICVLSYSAYSAYSMFVSNQLGHSLVDILHWSYKLNMLCIVLSFVFGYSAILYTMMLLIIEACIVYHLLKRTIVGEDVGILPIVFDVCTSVRNMLFSVAERVIRL
jgi:hypothetical protein